nr:NBS-LRR disease resistance protein [Dasypyrum villosum]
MDVVGAASWLVQVVLEKLVGDGMDAAWAAARAADPNPEPGGDVHRLRSRLQGLHLVLSAAQERVPRARSEALLGSLRRLHELASDADNLLDEMLYHQIYSQLHPDEGSDTSSSSSVVQSVVSKIRGAKRARIGGDDDVTATVPIDEILKKMCEAGDDVREAIKMEKLDAVVTCRGLDAGMDRRGPTTAFVTEPKIFGRDVVKEHIVETLVSAEACGVNLSVLPIVGNGGVGKTTLAQLVYNDARVKGCFSKRIWISVSADFDEARITREMLDCVSTGVSKHEGITNLNKLQEVLDEDLKSKRLLLVLDDMWEDNDKSRWDKLLAPLRSSMNGNVILVTTRNRSVVKMVSTMDPIHLDGLKDDDFWLMFKSCAFGDEKYEGHPSLQVIGQRIANKLKGYPLATKSVGALLKRALDGGHWMSVLQSDEWKLQQGPDDIIPALKLSYIHLPFHLQRCFSYCSLFPKGNRFDGLDLVRIWISQGFVSSRNKRMEETGYHYLNDLVDRGFFQRSTYYYMHDLIHDLAHIVSLDECQMIDNFDLPSGTVHPTRKLAYIGEEVQTKNLSTLMLFGKYVVGFSETFSKVFKEVQHLRVLRLSTLTYNIDSLLSNFSKLIHLRYLELISSGPVGPLPEVICRLYHLQVLDVEYWVDLTTLPHGMNNLLNLRHFVARAELHAKIAGVGRLKFLQELKEFRVGKTKDFQIEQLKGLRELGGSLAIYNLENVGSREESWNAGLRDKIYMHDLQLSWCKNRFDVSSVTEAHVLEGLHPHSALKRLHITSYGGICSTTWLSSNFSLTSLESIYLENCTKWELLPPLGQFPLLKTLHLIQLPASTEVPVMSCDDWTESEKHVLFPCLEELTIRDCPKLRLFALPRCSSNDKGFHSFGCLRRVNIYNCPQLIDLSQFGEMKSLSIMSIEVVGSFPDIRLFVRALHIKGSASVRTLDEILTSILTYCRLSGLVKLTIASFLDLAYLPWENFSRLLSLEMLVIMDCPKFFLPAYSYDQGVPSLLKKLVIQECGITGKQLSDFLLQLPFLYFLTIGSCPKIASLSVGGLITGNFSSSTSYNQYWTIDGLLQIPRDLLNRLEYLCIEDFPDLVLLCNEGFLGFISLKTLHITGCPQFFFSIMTEKESSDSCPELTSIVLHSCTSLETFIIEKCARLSALDSMGSPCSIKHMRIFECPSLAIPCGPSSPDGQNKDLYFLLRIEKLEIDNASFFSTSICKSLPSLQHVVFFMAKNIRSFTEEQDKALCHLTSLHILDFCYCSELISLPKELYRLSSVKKLSIKACPGILSLPEKGLPASLQELYVSNSSTELKEQCRKIKNVRCVYVDRHASKFISICKMLRLYFRNQKK